MTTLHSHPARKAARLMAEAIVLGLSLATLLGAASVAAAALSGAI